jgi:hypothetical protein
MRDSIVNKTLLTNRARRIMGNQAPGDYLRQLENEAGLPGPWLDDIVATHLIDPAYLRANEFTTFYIARSTALLALIESAMGRHAVPPEAAPETVDDYQPEPVA